MSNLIFSEKIGRLLRQDSPVELGNPTRPFILQAIRNQDAEAANRWLDYYRAEQQSILNIYSVWNWYMVRYYLDKKPDATLQSAVEKSMAPWAGATAGLTSNPVAKVSTDGNHATLSVAGLAWDILLLEGDQRYDITLGTPAEAEQRMVAWRQRVDAAIHAFDEAQVDQLIDEILPELWLVHDLHADWSWALLSLFMREWGEGILDEVLRVTEEPWVNVRYAAIAELSQEEALQLTVEGMRGHFTGAQRAGQVKIDDESDRWVMSFDACGSGGRMRRGDAIVGSGSRLDAPYHFLNVEGAYDWTWNQKGVCSYCTHCAVVNQILPIENLGYPMRMVEYPINAHDPCRWIIYKSTEGFPEKAYSDVGKSK